jgi:serine/threonine protein kinase
MGAVYKARQPRLDRFVALKILTRQPDRGITDTEFAARFQQEARALARINHPDIVAVYDFGEAGGYHYLLMEYVDGLTLRQLLQTRKLLPEQALSIVPKICEALQFAHERGIVHRDIKPENILLDKQGRVKIADFGIAKILGAQAAGAALTGVKDVIGTPHYMAPEQVEKPATVDHRADIYSLGVVFYEMLTGELPLGNFQRPSRKVQVDVRLDEVVLHALEKEPDRRYQHASEVKTDLETIAATPESKSEIRNPKPEIEQSLLTSVATRSQKCSPWRRAAVTALAVFAIVFALLAIVTALLPRAYEAKAKIIVRDEKLNSVRSDGELDWALRDVIWSFRGPILQDQVATELDLHKRWAGRFRTPDLKEDKVRELLAKQLVIERIPRTATFEVSCFSTRPDEAAEIANKAAEIFCASPAGAKASLIERATPPRRYARPNAPLNLAFAAALGLVLGIVFGAGVLLVAALRPAAFESAPPPKPTSTASVQPRSATIARWSARILGTLWVLIFLAFLMGEGSLPFGQQPAAVQLEFVAMALMFAGCLAGWWRDLPAVLLTLGGWMLFHAAEQHLRAFSILHVPLLTGVLFSVSWNARYPARRAKLVNWIAPIAIPLFVALLATGATKSKPVPTPAATNVVTAKSISAVSVPPVVTATFPPSGAAEIDPALTEIRVTFSKPMQDGNWSWNHWSDESFPQMTGEPKYLDDQRTCVLPVRLVPGKVYALWLNSEQRNNFKDREGRAALPYLLIFETRNQP